MNFVAIDFETANKNFNSAISLAAVTVEKNAFKKEAFSLIKPPVMDFLDDFIRIHQIRPEQVENKPTFAEMWAQIKPHLDGKIVVAHNAKFDMEVLRSVLQTYNLSWPNFKYACSLEISRKVWPSLPSHSLDNVAKYLGIEFQHHQALDDARVCALIILAAANELGVSNFDELIAKTMLEFKPLRNGEFSQSNLI